MLFAAAGLVAISSCKKEEEEEAKKTNTENLTASAWVMKSITANPGIDLGTGGPITDLFIFEAACSKDDTEKYNTDGTGIFDEGATKCDPADPQTDNFTWSFANGETKLVMDKTDTFNLVQLDGSTLKISQEIDASEFGGTPGTKHTITIGYGKK